MTICDVKLEVYKRGTMLVYYRRIAFFKYRKTHTGHHISLTVTLQNGHLLLERLLLVVKLAQFVVKHLEAVTRLFVGPSNPLRLEFQLSQGFTKIPDKLKKGSMVYNTQKENAHSVLPRCFILHYFSASAQFPANYTRQTSRSIFPQHWS